MKQIILFGIALIVSACTNYYKYPTHSENGNPFVVVEIPAGTNLKYEYDTLKNKFDLERLSDDSPRKIQYLPYPVNYGFVPSTLRSVEDGGDGDPLDVLAISSNIKQGSILEFIPVAIIHMTDDGQEDDKIVGVVVNSEVAVIECKSLSCLESKYPGIIKILETWMSSYDPEGKSVVEGWGDEKEAREYISKWKVIRE